MPIYEYKCVRCGKVVERYELSYTTSEQCNSPICCGEKAQRLISKNQGKPVVINYYSENADAHFTGPKQRDKVLKEKNLALMPEGITKFA